MHGQWHSRAHRPAPRSAQTHLSLENLFNSSVVVIRHHLRCVCRTAYVRVIGGEWSASELCAPPRSHRHSSTASWFLMKLSKTQNQKPTLAIAMSQAIGQPNETMMSIKLADLESGIENRQLEMRTRIFRSLAPPYCIVVGFVY